MLPWVVARTPGSPLAVDYDDTVTSGGREAQAMVWEFNASSMRRRLQRGNKTHHVDIGAVAETRVNQDQVPNSNASTWKLKRRIRCI